MVAEVAKPDFQYVWASGGAIVAPSTVKGQTGWVAEVPPFQWENYLQNRQDNAIMHLFQKGISVWDTLSNYYFTTNGVRSYVQGSNGLIYVAVQNSIGQNPVTDVSNTYWKVAFADNSNTLLKTNNLSDLANLVTARTNLQVYSKTESDNLRMKRVQRQATNGVVAIVGASTAPVTITALNVSFTGDGSMYSIICKINLNVETINAATAPSNACVVKLLNGATPLDITASNIVVPEISGRCLVLSWSGPLTGAVALTVTFEKTWGNGSLTLNGDRDDTTSNISGQSSVIDVYRMGN